MGMDQGVRLPPPVSEMTYTVSTGMLTLLYHTIPYRLPPQLLIDSSLYRQLVLTVEELYMPVCSPL